MEKHNQNNNNEQGRQKKTQTRPKTKKSNDRKQHLRRQNIIRVQQERARHTIQTKIQTTHTSNTNNRKTIPQKNTCKRIQDNQMAQRTNADDGRNIRGSTQNMARLHILQRTQKERQTTTLHERTRKHRIIKIDKEYCFNNNESR